MFYLRVYSAVFWDNVPGQTVFIGNSVHALVLSVLMLCWDRISLNLQPLCSLQNSLRGWRSTQLLLVIHVYDPSWWSVSLYTFDKNISVSYSGFYIFLHVVLQQLHPKAYLQVIFSLITSGFPKCGLRSIDCNYWINNNSWWILCCVKYITRWQWWCYRNIINNKVVWCGTEESSVTITTMRLIICK